MDEAYNVTAAPTAGGHDPQRELTSNSKSQVE